MKNSFSFSKTKLIIPIIFLLIFISVFYSTNYLGKQADNYSCKLSELLTNYTLAKEKNDTAGMNRAVADIEVTQDELTEIISDKKTILTYAVFSNRVLDKIPIYPTDCGLTPEKNLCSFYMSQESYSCVKNLISIGGGQFSVIINDKIPEYRPINYLLLILNLAIFLILGYLLSCIIALIYSKYKIKR